MSDSLLKGIFDSGGTQVVSVTSFLLCIFVSLAIGLILALAYMYKSKYTKSFAATLTLLPAIVCIVIMMVNGNIGAGVAVAGTFSLVRFRSAQGTAREIGAVFLAMAAGLLTGMGYLGYAALFTLILSAAMLVYTLLDFGGAGSTDHEKTLHITIPEDLDYTGVFDEIFAEYTSSHKLMQVRTSNMGSLYKLTYNLTLKNPGAQKEFIDKLRCRNGNLEIAICSQETLPAEL